MPTTTKKIQEGLVEKMKEWEKIEDAAMASTGKIMEKSDHPLVHMVMEIIQADSRMHHQVQEFIAGSLERKAISLTPEDMAEVWGAIEKHIALERKMVVYVEEALATLKGKKLLVQEYLLHYLKTDEQKHNKLLEDLKAVQKGMYPYA